MCQRLFNDLTNHSRAALGEKRGSKTNTKEKPEGYAVCATVPHELGTHSNDALYKTAETTNNTAETETSQRPSATAQGLTTC